jgi:hypothetical protein
VPSAGNGEGNFFPYCFYDFSAQNQILATTYNFIVRVDVLMVVTVKLVSAIGYDI